MARVKCHHCGKKLDKPAGEIMRAKKAGLNLYCNRRCSGLGRRCGKTKAQRVKEKAVYDAEYRKKNRAMLKAKKAAYFQRTYDPVKAARERKKNMARHVEYCRQPEYRKYKQQYDKKYRAKKLFGPFAEAAMLTVDLNREIKGRMSNAQIKWENKTSNKSQRREGEAAQACRGRPRHRERRDRHSTAIGQ